MTTFPSVTGRELISALAKAGLHADGRTTVVPVHSGETIGPGLLSKILRDCELSRQDMQKLL